MTESLTEALTTEHHAQWYNRIDESEFLVSEQTGK